MWIELSNGVRMGIEIETVDDLAEDSIPPADMTQ